MTKEEFKEVQGLLGLTNLELAQKLGKSEPSIGKWRSGENKINIHIEKKMKRLGTKKIYHIADLLNSLCK